MKELIFVALLLWVYCDIQVNYSHKKRKEYNNIKYFIIGFLVCWFSMCVFVVISEEFLDNGIILFDDWGTTILLLPIIPFFAITKFLLHRKNKKKNNKENTNK